jgi:acetyltransferase-like isoleucine patch superfamily enzyme
MAIKAIREIGWRRALRFGWRALAIGAYGWMGLPPLRAFALRLLGARVGRDVVIHDVRFLNIDRTGPRGLQIGDECFLGEGGLIDLADRVVLERQVTLGPRVTILTHVNVGYADHPLQDVIPKRTGPVVLRRGAFIGACATILSGVEVGECAVVAAGAVVRADVPPHTVVGGVPARVIREAAAPHAA